jgi:predicted acylesterase/phospholipase RssA
MDTLYLSPGGIKGYSILGVISVLEKKQLLQYYKTIMGSSVGSIIGLLIIIGYNSKSIYKLLLNDLEDILFKKQMNQENILLNLINFYGINNGNKYKNLLQYLLKEKKYKIDITFKELYEETHINFIVVTSDIRSSDLFYFNKNDTPNYSVINSIMASTCIPLIFQPIYYEDKILVDGGYFNNIKMRYLDSNTLIVNIKSHSNYIDMPDDLNLFEYSKLLINSLVKSVQNITNYDSLSIINLEFDSNGISLNINNEDRKNLYIYGILTSFKFFKRRNILKKYFDIIKNNK